MYLMKYCKEAALKDESESTKFYACRKETRIWAIGGLIIGCIFFGVLVGYKVLNPFYYDWIFSGGQDSAVSLFGSLFYLKTSYKDALFGTFDITYPHELSIVFTDCIIPFALFAKFFFSKFFKEGQIIQYLGIWGITCYALQGLFAGLIVSKLMDEWLMRIGGIIFFVTSPLIIFRLFEHNTLAAHWLLLAGMSLFFYRYEIGRKRWIFWVFLVMLGTSIHLYFFPMLLLLMGGQFIYEYIEGKNWRLPCLSIVFAIWGSIAEIWMFGAFRSEVAVADPDYSTIYIYSSNLLTFFNPTNTSNYSLFMPNLNQIWGEYEGYGYLGLGGLILFFISVCYIFFVLYKWVRNRDKKNIKLYGYVAIYFLFCFALAVGPRITCGEKVLAQISMPEFTNFFFATFRSIGRFIWIDVYIIFALSLYTINRIKTMARKKGLICVLFLLIVILQVVDLTPAIKNKREIFATEQKWDYKIKDKKWDELAKSHDYVYVIFEGSCPSPTDYFRSLALYSYSSGLKLTSMNIAHPSDTMKKDSEQYLQEVKEKKANKNAIYWLENENLMNQVKPYIHCEIIDGMYIGWVE